MPNVSYKCPDYVSAFDKWSLISDCLAGQAAIKSKGTTYLPMPQAQDTSPANQLRYKQYGERAVFYNATYRTLSGMTGQVFQQPPEVKVPAIMASLLPNIDGAGVSLVQQAKRALEYVLSYGRCGILTDYPDLENGSTLAELQTGYIRPVIHLYEPWRIINWRTKAVGARNLLSLVVLEEEYAVYDDGFEMVKATQYRVLYLDEAGHYAVDLWRSNEASLYEIVASYSPKDAAGLPFNEIPFVFVGSINNDTLVDRPPLYDLAILNIAHYRNSADYEESCYMVGQPTPYFAGLTKTWVEEVLKGVVQLGSRAAVPLPAGGTAGLLQASPNIMPKEAMEQKEKQMVALGAKLMEQQAVQRTATEATQDEVCEVSILSMCVLNVSEAYVGALTWAERFMTTVLSEISIQMKPSYEDGTMSPEERARLVADWQAGAITFTETRNALRRSGIATEPDEKASAEASLKQQKTTNTGDSNGP